MYVYIATGLITCPIFTPAPHNRDTELKSPSTEGNNPSRPSSVVFDGVHVDRCDRVIPIWPSPAVAIPLALFGNPGTIHSQLYTVNQALLQETLVLLIRGVVPTLKYVKLWDCYAQISNNNVN